MNKPRRGKKIISPNGIKLFMNNKDNEWLVLETEDGEAVARQAKRSSGRVYKQASTFFGSPDYEGRESYQLDYYKNERWKTLNSQSKKRELINPDFLSFIGF